ncbi:response regulator [Geomonas sp. RF6]|uniref:response regulator n=1 Tax=Geomonas sp. RF6 TaxID=2897342 RepID=UPI001E330047|nr:response regulator [Geomonas sp. RF6]UFS69982.1 response regulator [Geomonas sp. RF6]
MVAAGHSPFSLLMAEDDLDTRDIILRMIARKFPHCTVYAADNGREGLDLFRKHSPEVVITDINMPFMNGIEMTREIRSLGEKAAFIILTAYRNQSFKEEISDLGYCAYLLKPVVFKDLIEAIDRCRGHLASGE